MVDYPPGVSGGVRDVELSPPFYDNFEVRVLSEGVFVNIVVEKDIFNF